MFFDENQVRENARRAETEDLLDRVTVFRPGLEPEAIVIFEDELRRRGVTPADIEVHARRREETGLLERAAGPIRCHYCFRPAAGYRWRFNSLWGWIPLLPHRFPVCHVHQ